MSLTGDYFHLFEAHAQNNAVESALLCKQSLFNSHHRTDSRGASRSEVASSCLHFCAHTGGKYDEWEPASYTDLEGNYTLSVSWLRWATHVF